MSRHLSCQSTAWPDGVVVYHSHGMVPLERKDLKPVMKQAIINNVNHKVQQTIQILNLNRFKNATDKLQL